MNKSDTKNGMKTQGTVEHSSRQSKIVDSKPSEAYTDADCSPMLREV